MSSIGLPEDWERQRAFLAVVKAGSLSGAARALGLAHPTVRRRIEELEASAGAPLFTRSPAGLTPTEMGLALVDHAAAMALAADAFRRTASAAAGEIAGTVRITASDVVTVEVLPPILASLRARHPALSLILSPSNRNEDVLRREADVAVRMVRPQQDGLAARRIGAVELGLHGRRDLLDRVGWPETLAEVGGKGLVGPEHDNEVLRGLRASDFPIELDHFVLRTDSDLAQNAAIRGGVALGLCQVPLARGWPDVVRLFADEIGFPLDVWLVTHEDLRGVARIRAVLDHLAEGLAVYLS